MTRDRDIERVLDRFYAEGPSEMPDRVFLGVFDRIERVPQRRLAAQLTRFATMNTNLRLAAAAAIVVAIVGLGAFALSQRPTVGPSSSAGPSPTASVAGSFAPQSLPISLRGNWVGAPRVVPQLPEPPYRDALQLTDVQLAFEVNGAPQKEFASIAALTAADRIRVLGASTDGGCTPGDEGTYSFRLGASGTTLTLTPIADACAPRAAALTGDWTHAACPNAQDYCLGDLAAGAHVSTIFTPFVPLTSWQYRYGAFSYTVPAGWSNTEDCAGCYILAKQGAPANTNINVWSEVAAHRQDDQCTGGPAPGVGRTADPIVTWLTSLPGLVTTAPAPITIGGLSGKMVDLSVKPTWTATCPYGDPPGRPMVSTFSDPVRADGLDWNIQSLGRTRIIALDLGDGRALVIDIEAQTQADYDALLPDAMQVVNTFQFKP